MIEFKGEPTGECRKFLLKKQVKIQATGSIVSATIFTIPTIATAILWKPIALLFLIPLGLLVIFSLITPAKSSQKNFMPKRVYIDLEEESIVHECEKMERFHMLHSVEKVLDYCEWYYFVFNYENRDPYFVCQKSLLSSGSIEEFEALFEGKIERRTK